MVPFYSFYDWLNDHFFDFLRKLGLDENYISWNAGIITAHGDKLHYSQKLKDAGLCKEHAIAIFLLTHLRPWCAEVRNGGSSIYWSHELRCEDWVIANKDRFLPHLPPVKENNYV